ncbi:cupin domain-containing protein [Sphingomonas edaphi]|uniref:Cupin n=1 Tax=Sphingomonas edaphi TaxID=2315689 RepID=A0A418PYZ0_9SPHN|nr:cupin [Sphingomonas edaphi]RIX27282.1 cupin [Sphingomonas edaphi]
MQIYDAMALRGPDDWSGPTLPAIGNAVAKLRWISTPFRWHRNTGRELFMVIDGEVDMHVRAGPDAPVDVVNLTSGSMVLIDDGEEHVAYPRGEARILVVEQEQSE